MLIVYLCKIFTFFLLFYLCLIWLLCGLGIWMVVIGIPVCLVLLVVALLVKCGYLSIKFLFLSLTPYWWIFSFIFKILLVFCVFVFLMFVLFRWMIVVCKALVFAFDCLTLIRNFLVGCNAMGVFYDFVLTSFWLMHGLIVGIFVFLMTLRALFNKRVFLWIIFWMVFTWMKYLRRIAL